MPPLLPRRISLLLLPAALSLACASPPPIQPQVQPTGPQRLIGEFRYLADAPSFRPCAEARPLPVAQEGDYLALERAYLARQPAGAPLTVSLQGRLLPRPSAEPGQAPRRSLVVDRFERIEATGCPGAAALVGTRWLLAELPGATPDPGGQAPVRPELVLGPDGRLSGSGGCNRLQGGYQLEADGRLKLGRMVSTMRACVGGMAQEQQLLQALGQVARYESGGRELRLLDAEGKLLVRFEAAEP